MQDFLVIVVETSSGVVYFAGFHAHSVLSPKLADAVAYGTNLQGMQAAANKLSKLLAFPSLPHTIVGIRIERHKMSEVLRQPNAVAPLPPIPEMAEAV